MTALMKSSPEIELRRLIDIVSKLRGPEGCPWDMEQTPETMIPFLLEEACFIGNHTRVDQVITNYSQL